MNSKIIYLADYKKEKEKQTLLAKEAKYMLLYNVYAKNFNVAGWDHLIKMIELMQYNHNFFINSLVQNITQAAK